MIGKIVKFCPFGQFNVLFHIMYLYKYKYKELKDVKECNTDHGVERKDISSKATSDEFFRMYEESCYDIDCTKNKCLGVYDECHLI